MVLCTSRETQCVRVAVSMWPTTRNLAQGKTMLGKVETVLGIGYLDEYGCAALPCSSIILLWRIEMVSSTETRHAAMGNSLSHLELHQCIETSLSSVDVSCSA